MNCKNCNYCKELKNSKKFLCIEGNFYLTKEETENKKCDLYFNSIEDFKRKNNFK